MPPPPLHWDIFCRVIDNHGDLGVCLRLARQLHALGDAVRLWCDDLRDLRWMDPDLAAAPPAGLQIADWPGDATTPEPADVVIEAFACDPPPAFVARMAERAARGAAPVWLNLEYLSAEPWVGRCHGLPSPQHSGPGAGLTKWFFHPGFTPATGGLLREPDWARTFDATAATHDQTLARLGLQRRPGEQVVLLFCYDNAPVAGLCAALEGQPTLLLAAAGAAAALAGGLKGGLKGGLTDGLKGDPKADGGLPGGGALPSDRGLRVAALPWLSQADFDAVLAAADLNLVRGEDSLVRASWAARPMLWQLYPQDDGAHAAKLQAWLDAGPVPDGLPALMRWWNGLHAAGGEPASAPPWPDRQAWQTAVRQRRDALLAQADLVTQMRRFVHRHAAPRTPTERNPG